MERNDCKEKQATIFLTAEDHTIKDKSCLLGRILWIPTMYSGEADRRLISQEENVLKIKHPNQYVILV